MSKGGIADRMIAFNGFPFLDNKEDHSFGVPISTAMTTAVTCFPATGLELADVHRILSENKFQGYPIVDDLSSRVLLGYIGRTELLYAINRLQREQHISKKARCYFTPTNPTAGSAQSPASAAPAVTFDTMAATAGQMTVDFSRFIDATPLSVHPRLPLETVMEIFKKMGPRVILIEHRGKLTGLVTVKDCLKYQFKVEAHEHVKDDSLDDSNERIWQIISRVGRWFGKRRHSLRWGAVQLGDSDVDRRSLDRNQELRSDPDVRTPLRTDGHESELELESR